MSCKVSKYDICVLKKESWRPKEIVFPSKVNVNNDLFKYTISKFGVSVKEFDLIAENNVVALRDPELTIGSYTHELIWETNGQKTIVFTGNLEVTNTANSKNCGCSESDVKTISVNTSNTTLNVSIDNLVITGNGEGASYTLPTASATVKGGVKIGANLSIDSNGVLSATASGSGIASIETDSTNKSVTLSGDGTTETPLTAEVKIDGTTIVKSSNGTLSAVSSGSGSGMTPEQIAKLNEIDNKVNQVSGKSLIADTEITRLAGVNFNEFLKESPAEEITVKTKNLINYNLFEGATYAVNSSTKKITKSASTSWISVVVSEGFVAGEDYFLQGYGTISNGAVVMVIFGNSEDVEISSILKSDFTGVIRPPAGTTKIYIRLVNGTNVGADPINSTYKNTAQLAKGTTSSDFEPYGNKTILVPGVKYLKQTDLITYSNVYVSYSPNGYQEREEIIFYTRRGDSNYYVGFFVRHELDTTDLVYSNQLRITKANEYLYEENQMKLIAENVIFGGESECVYQQTDSDKVDFTGGVHGDEQMIFWDIFIDGVPQSKTTELKLKPCKTASYIQKSTMHETAKTGGVIIENHPTQAVHYKNTAFIRGGYETQNALEWKVSIPFFWYHGIACIGKYSATAGFSDSLINTPMIGSLETFYNLPAEDAQSQGIANGWSADKVLQKTKMKRARKVEYWNDVNNKGAVVESWLESDYLKDDETLLFVHDRANDSKYYRRTLTTNSVIGAIDRSIMRVTFK